jgi:putative SOS response-associated peptidase YedK
MCGRYYIDQEEYLAEMRQILEEVNRRYQATDALAALRVGEIKPSHTVPVLRAEPAPVGSGAPDRIVPDLMQWGFPRWQGSGLIINARAETASAKPMFRQALQQCRMLIPAGAFFEWQHFADGRKGQKMRLSLTDEPVFYMAGLARYFDDKDAAEPLMHFVILTTAANPSVAVIHDRMPLILPRRLLRDWVLDERRALDLLSRPVDRVLRLEESA